MSKQLYLKRFEKSEWARDTTFNILDFTQDGYLNPA